jgi:hypothetical protein
MEMKILRYLYMQKLISYLMNFIIFGLTELHKLNKQAEAQIKI